MNVAALDVLQPGKITSPTAQYAKRPRKVLTHNVSGNISYDLKRCGENTRFSVPDRSDRARGSGR